MPIIRRKGTVALLLEHVHTFRALLSHDDKLAAFKALALIFGTEEYDTNPDDYVPSTSYVAAAALKPLVEAVVADDFDLRSELRPCLDFVRKHARTSARK